MKEVFRSNDTGQIGLYQSILDDAGIPTFVQNNTAQQSPVAALATALFPIPEFWPALCVLEDEDYPEAMTLLQATREAAEEPAGADWICRTCGETVPGNFTSCWKCSQPHEKGLPC